MKEKNKKTSNDIYYKIVNKFSDNLDDYGKAIKDEIESLNKKDPKYLGIPNINFSLIDSGDKREKEYSKQRLKKGFDDSETWSLCSTIFSFTLPRLKRYRDITAAYPSSCKDMNSWIKKLDKMIRAMELYIKHEGDIFPSPKEEKEFNKGYKLFKKYMLALWW